MGLISTESDWMHHTTDIAPIIAATQLSSPPRVYILAAKESLFLSIPLFFTSPHVIPNSYASIMPGVVSGPRTLYDKVFEDHIVDEKKDGTVLLYIGMSG